MFRRTVYRIAVVATTTPAVLYDLPTIITNITTWVVGLLIGVATLFLTIGGLRYLAAGGDPTEIEKAKSAFNSALLGYALAVLAPILLAVVKGWIGGLRWAAGWSTTSSTHRAAPHRPARAAHPPAGDVAEDAAHP